MIKKILNSISKFFFLLFLRLNIKKNYSKNFKDLNFKHNDFTNYKLVRHYIFKENFINNVSITDIHTFNFLFFFEKIGGKNGINLSKKNIFLWFDKFKNYKNFPWVDSLSAKRFLNIIYSYDFICSISGDKEIITLNQIINFHKKRLIFDISKKRKEDISSSEIIAITLIKCMEDNLDISYIKKIEEIINSQLDEISMHKSYNILEHARFLNNLNELKNIMLFFNKEISKNFNHKILAMTSLLSSYRHDDFSLPLFNGCNNNHNDVIQKIIHKEQFLKTRPFKNFINGIALYKDSKKTLFFDVVQPTTFGFNKELSAGSLSIEISSNGEKIITNCGGAESTGKNPSYLKYTAAHSTIIINNTNISEIREGKNIKIFPKKVLFEKKNEDDISTLKGTHNGYLKNYGKICKRELRIKKNQSKVEGEDIIISTKSNFEKTIYHIRFHLMPNISTTLTKNKKNIIIKTKKNNIWLFKADQEVAIEKSIFIENDMAKETTQIVITGTTSSLKNKIKWSLEKI